MKIKVDQQSEEWWRLRKLKLSASKADAIAANGKGLKTYVMELLQDYYSMAEKENFSNMHTDRGNSLESSASFLYSMETGIEAKKAGYETYGKYPDFVGCSPDLYCDGNGLAEIKCFADKGYFDYLVNRKIDTKYMWQMQMQMLVCGREWNDYTVYNPNFSKEIIIKRVEPDEKAFAKLETGFESGIQMLQEIKSKMDKVLGKAA